MKKIFLTAIFAISMIFAQGQGLFDALRYSDYGINGSARYMSMAGSFGALGGEVCAAIDNPAALGIFRSSEISVSANITSASSYATWGYTNSKNQATYFGINNLSWVFNIPTYKESGYLSSNISFGYHKIKDFNRTTFIQNQSPMNVSLANYIADYSVGLPESAFDNDAYNNDEIGWLSILGYETWLINPDENASNKWLPVLNNGEGVLPYYRSNESGYIGEYNFTYSGNVNDFVYFGAGISLQSLNYSKISTYYEEFEEGGDFYLDNTFLTSGIGINFKLGAIVRPTKFLRLGLSFTTPSYYAMTDIQQSATLNSLIFEEAEESTPDAKTNYSFHSPLKLQASVGFILGKVSAINVDYQFSNQNKMHFLGNNYNHYIDDNQDITNYAKAVHTVKAGVEFRLGDYVKLRGGFAYISAPVSENAQKNLPYNSTRTDAEYFAPKHSIYGSVGVGFAFKNNMALDFAYANGTQYQAFAPFQATGRNDNKANLKTSRNNFVATFALRY
jgi:hypothetical protein